MVRRWSWSQQHRCPQFQQKKLEDRCWDSNYKTGHRSVVFCQTAQARKGVEMLYHPYNLETLWTSKGSNVVSTNSKLRKRATDSDQNLTVDDHNLRKTVCTWGFAMCEFVKVIIELAVYGRPQKFYCLWYDMSDMMSCRIWYVMKTK